MTSLSFLRLRMPLALVTLLHCWSQCEAGSTFVYSRNPIGAALANAGSAARADDASVTYWNPASMTTQPRNLQFGMDFLDVSTTIADRGSRAATPGTGGQFVPYAAGASGDPASLELIPNFYFVTPLRQRDIWFGVAVTVPYGIALEYPANWFGRYDTTLGDLQTLQFSPVAAFRLSERVSLGAGIDVMYADGKLANAMPDPLNVGGPTPSSDAGALLAGDDWSLGFNIGLAGRIGAAKRWGIHYRSTMEHTLDGTVRIDGLNGPLAPLNGTTGASAKLALPDSLTAGLVQELGNDFSVYFEAQWFGWSEFDELRVQMQNGLPDIVINQGYTDTLSYAVGISRRIAERWVVRTGLRFEESPSVDDWRNASIPDADSRILGVGFSYRFSDRMSFDMAYIRTRFDRADIAVTKAFYEGSPLASVADLRGRTNSHGDNLSFAVRYTPAFAGAR